MTKKVEDDMLCSNCGGELKPDSLGHAKIIGDHIARDFAGEVVLDSVGVCEECYSIVARIFVPGESPLVLNWKDLPQGKSVAWWVRINIDNRRC